MLAEIALSPDVERLVNARLDSVEKALLNSGVSRSERSETVEQLELEILDQLYRINSQEWSREDVLSVLNRLPVPESYYAAPVLLEEPVPRLADRELPLCLWSFAGGLLVSVGAMLTFLATLSVFFIELQAIPVLLGVQIIPSIGELLALTAVVKFWLRPGTRRGATLAWAALLTMPLTMILSGSLALTLVKQDEGLLLMIIFYGFPGGAFVHSLWMAALTAHVAFPQTWARKLWIRHLVRQGQASAA